MKIYNFIQIGKKFFDNGEYENALKIFLKIYKKGIIQKDIIYFIIFSYFQRGDYYSAVFYIIKFEKNFGFDKRVFIVKNLILGDFGHYEKIIKNYKNINDLENEFEFILLGNLNRNIGEYKKSLEIFKNGIRKFPKNSRFLYNLALILNILGRENESLFFTKKSFEIDGYLYSLDLFLRILSKKGFQKQKLLYFFQTKIKDILEYKNDFTCIGNIFYTLGDYTKSEFFYKKSIENTKYDFYAYNGLGNIYFQNSDYKKAKTYYKYSLLINKQNFYTLNSLGKIFYKENNLETSEKFYGKSLKIKENNFEALKNLGIIYYKKGEFQKSKKFLQKSLLLNKNDFMVNRYLNRIKTC